MNTLNILVTGGGSSGHISPALAIIQTLRDLAALPGADWQPRFLYVGGKSGLEQELVQAQDIPFTGVQTGKLRRYMSRANLTDALRVPYGMLQSLGVVKNFKPHVVLATGGYVAVPPVIAAWLLRVPIIIHEQTVQIGLANRIAARCATRIALSWESALCELSPAQRAKAWVPGNPVRSSVLGGSPAEAMRIAGFDPADAGLATVYVTGGSQGSRLINRTVEAALPELLKQCLVIHQCGRQPEGTPQDLDRLLASAAKLDPKLRRRYFVLPFVRDEIKDVYALARLVIGRSGAGTVSELCTLGKAAVYVPLVPTGGDEQTRNASMCVKAGAAVVIPQREFDSARLLQVLGGLLSDKERLGKMGQAATTLARPDAACDLANAVLTIARQKAGV